MHQQAENQDTEKPEKAVVSFVINLLSTHVKKVAKTYLKEESDETVRKALVTIPKLVKVKK